MDSVTNDTIQIIRRVKGESNTVLITEGFFNELLIIVNDFKFMESKKQLEDGSRIYY